MEPHGKTKLPRRLLSTDQTCCLAAPTIELLKAKIAAGVYEFCNASYRNVWFWVAKKDGTSLRIVHDVQPLNELKIRDAGLIPNPDEFSYECAGRTLYSTFDLIDSYSQHADSRDLTAFQTPL